ncbi:MAG: hypothetical protein WBC07_09145 [Methylotenera sp.]
MTEFRKFLIKYHLQIIAVQMLLILGAVLNQADLEQGLMTCKAKAGLFKPNPPLPKF